MWTMSKINIEDVIDVVLVPLLLILSIFHTIF